MKDHINLSNILIALVAGCWIYQGFPLDAKGLGTTMGNAVSFAVPILLIWGLAKWGSKDK
jgi:hypothetical protein